MLEHRFRCIRHMLALACATLEGGDDLGGTGIYSTKGVENRTFGISLVNTNDDERYQQWNDSSVLIAKCKCQVHESLQMRMTS